MFSESESGQSVKITLSSFFLYTSAQNRTLQYVRRLVHAQGRGGRREGSPWQLWTSHPPSLLYYLSLLEYATRLLLYALFQKEYTRVDPLMAVLDAITTHHLVGLCLAAFVVIAFYMDYVLTMAPPDRRLATVLIDLMVFNRAPLEAFNATGEPFSLECFLSPGWILQNILHLVALLRGKRLIRFARPRLHHYRTLSPVSRTRIALVSAVIELAFAAFVFLLSLGTLLAFVVFFFFPSVVLPASTGKWTVRFALVDFLQLMAVLRRAYGLVGCYATILVSVSLALYLHLTELTKATFQRVKVTSRGNYEQAATTWWHFFHQHSLALVDLVSVNSAALSTMVFWVFVPVLASNVYCIVLVYFAPLHVTVRFFLVDIILIQLAMFAILGFLDRVSGALYSAEGQLYRAQVWFFCGKKARNGDRSSGLPFNPYLLATKLKMAAYYEVLCTRNKIAFTFGSHSKIDSSWLWELLFFYISMILFSFKIFIKKRTLL